MNTDIFSYLQIVFFLFADEVAIISQLIDLVQSTRSPQNIQMRMKQKTNRMKKTKEKSLLLWVSRTFWMVVSQTNWRRQCTCITWTIISIHAKSIVLRSLVLEYELLCDCTLAHRRTQALYSTWFARYLVMHNPNVQSTLFHWIHVICVALFRYIR